MTKHICLTCKGSGTKYPTPYGKDKDGRVKYHGPYESPCSGCNGTGYHEGRRSRPTYEGGQ